MAGPLTTLKVLDFSSLLPGPFGAMLLADMGADVIKVESPTRPDLVRFLPPQEENVSAAHAYLNRSKKSLSVNLKTPEGLQVIKDLVKEYDVIIEQFRPGVMDKLGVGYEALKEINPGVIYCSISGYGQTGPYKMRAGHDLNYLSIAGMASYNGRKETGPAPAAFQVADIAGGSCHAVMGILAAVIHRQQTGVGQYIDISMTDAAFALNAFTAPAALVGGVEPTLSGQQLDGGSFYDCYETSDGRWFSAGGLEPQFFTQFCEAIGKPELIPNGYNLDPAVVAGVKASIAEAMKSKTFDEWKVIFAQLDSCTEPVLSFTEACEHEHIQAREMLVEVPKMGGGTQRQVASAFKFSETKPEYAYIGAPQGHHTREILAAAGYSEETLDQLKQQGVIS